MTEYQEKTKSFRHQLDMFRFAKDLKSYGLFWEMGCGKTKPTIDKACHLFSQGKIEAMIVIAPNGVHRNWANDEIPTHMPDRFRNNMALHIYNSGKAKLKKNIAARKALLVHVGGLRVLCISFSGIRTTIGKAFARRFMLKYKCFAVVDESQKIKSPGAKTTETVVAAGRYAPYKTILSGTPITNGPFDVYSQILFLDEQFWKKRQLHPYSVFKHHFGVYLSEQQFIEERGYKPNSEDQRLVDYRNLDELQSYLKLVTHRLTKESAGIVLPSKLYTKRYFQLTPQQLQVYEQLMEESVAFLPESGDWLETPEAIVKITRLQQILNGYVATEADEPIQRIDDKNPLLDLYIETIQDCPVKAITWSKYTPDIDFIMEALLKIGRRPVRYDGQVSDDQRELNKRAFQEGDATDFVGKPQAGATGLTLHAAETVHYYSNSYNAEHRWQSEDRAHRLGLKHSVLYFDYIAENTIANDIINNLRKKAKLAATLLGDAKVGGV